MSMEVTNNESRSIAFWEPLFQSELITFAGAATLLKGTILARRQVATAITAGAFVGTGDGTITLATVQPGPIVPLVGAYSLVCTAAVTNGGVFDLLDPNGAVVATGITMSPGAGGTTVINVVGMEFTITDGTADFVVADAAPLTVAADGKMVPFEKDGVGGAQIPKMILTQALTATGAGDLKDRPLISGQVRKGDLVIDSDGDASNVDSAVTDQLRDFTMVAAETTQLAEQDNQ